MTPKTKLKYRAFLCQGMSGGGGRVDAGEWRETYAEARTDLKTLPTFKPALGDYYSGIEVIPAGDLRPYNPKR